MQAGVIVAMGASLAAFAKPPPVSLPLPAQAREAISSTEVVAPIKQNEISTLVKATNFGKVAGVAGVLVSVGVDEGRKDAAAKSARPAVEAVGDYDFDARLKADLETSLSTVGFLKVSGVRVSKEFTDKANDKAIAGSSAAAVMITHAEYQFSPDGRSITVTLLADLYANSPALAAFKPKDTAYKWLLSHPGNSIYRNMFTHVTALPGATGDREANIALWAADNGKALRAALDAGSAAVARDLANDIQR